MTPANDPFGVAPVRRSAAFPCAIARGALPPGGPHRPASWRAGRLTALLLAATFLLPWPLALAEEQPRAKPIPRLVAEPGAARVPAARVIRAVDRSPATDRPIADRLGGDRPQRHADRSTPERTTERPTERPVAEPATRERRTDRSRGDHADRARAAERQAERPASRLRPEAAPQRQPGRVTAEAGERAASRAARTARTGRPAAQGVIQGRKPRQPRAPGSAPVLRDAPQELLPAPESMDLARATLPTTPRAACLAAARRAEQVHELPPGLLVAVAMSESSLHAHAIKVGSHSYHPRDLDRAREILAHAPRRSSPMVGCVQVNARVHAKGSDWPLDPLRSTDWAGGMLRRWHQETGDWVEALRRWHGGSARTEHAVLCRVRAKLEVANPENDMLRNYACAESEVAKVRRQGRGILEVAEYPDRAADGEATLAETPLANTSLAETPLAETPLAGAAPRLRAVAPQAAYQPPPR